MTKPRGGNQGKPGVDAKIDARFFRAAPGREQEVIGALMAASKDKDKAILSAHERLRSLKTLVDGVCWSNLDEAALALLTATIERFALEKP